MSCLSTGFALIVAISICVALCKATPIPISAHSEFYSSEFFRGTILGIKRRFCVLKEGFGAIQSRTDVPWPMLDYPYEISGDKSYSKSYLIIGKPYIDKPYTRVGSVKQARKYKGRFSNDYQCLPSVESFKQDCKSFGGIASVQLPEDRSKRCANDKATNPANTLSTHECCPATCLMPIFAETETNHFKRLSAGGPFEEMCRKDLQGFTFSIESYRTFSHDMDIDHAAKIVCGYDRYGFTLTRDNETVCASAGGVFRKFATTSSTDYNGWNEGDVTYCILRGQHIDGLQDDACVTELGGTMANGKCQLKTNSTMVGPLSSPSMNCADKLGGKMVQKGESYYCVVPRKVDFVECGENNTRYFFAEPDDPKYVAPDAEGVSSFGFGLGKTGIAILVSCCCLLICGCFYYSWRSKRVVGPMTPRAAQPVNAVEMPLHGRLRDDFCSAIVCEQGKQ